MLWRAMIKMNWTSSEGSPHIEDSITKNIYGTCVICLEPVSQFNLVHTTLIVVSFNWHKISVLPMKKYPSEYIGNYVWNIASMAEKSGTNI